ncbi:S66 family peptidase [Paenibacillus donghaensis]|uniref:LD-carboxypeptidase n=1 Tax=Paenibacillus donghaensis TaxID=414771 RepID=A0A2Z2KB31_9BACL|nr:S66 peptidase family protein [Paenibacillus donghaensis]ASA22884.1 LD-carboxypeptidase [Paenibacillus donghaensis]
MIKYPYLEPNTTIGVTAPSSGLKTELHPWMHAATSRLKAQGYVVNCGETVWTEQKAKSAPAHIRATELNAMLTDDSTGLIFPPWGGELLIETLEHLNLEAIKPKWVLGYSDISVLLLAITLRTGIATAHGTNLVDLRGETDDETTAMWQSILTTKTGESIVQHSSAAYQKEWPETPSPTVFKLTEPTAWRSMSGAPVRMQGRLLGGCIDVIRHLIGTPFGDVRRFREQFISNEPIVWFLENCELNTVDLRRSLVQMKLAGWFKHCAGIMFGRSPANRPVDGYTAEDVYADVAAELQLPVIYDIDCGHVPPQLTLINGAYAEIEVANGSGTVRQTFRP